MEISTGWRDYLRRYAIEHWYRFANHSLHGKLPQLSTPQQSQVWAALIPLATLQLYLARQVAPDHPRPWQKRKIPRLANWTYPIKRTPSPRDQKRPSQRPKNKRSLPRMHLLEVRQRFVNQQLSYSALSRPESRSLNSNIMEMYAKTGEMSPGFTRVLAALFLYAAFTAQSSHARPTAFVGATAIDGTGAGPRPNAVVVVAGERIIAVGDRAQIAVPKEAQVIDVSGKWIIPGLIDAHVHFFQSGSLYTRPDVIDLRRIRPYKTEIDGIKAHLPDTFARYLASGVTSVVDVGGPFWNFKVRELARRQPVAPRAAVAGPLISTYLPPAFVEVEDPPLLKMDSPEAARVLVRRELAYKPDLIKIWFIPSPDQDLVVQTTWVQAAIAESHAAGLRVVVHATQLEVARAAVRAGADILAHSVDDRRLDEAFIQLLKDRKVVYVTTLMVHEGYQEVLEQQVKLTEIEQRFGDPEVIATFDDLAELPFWKRPFWAHWRWPDRRVMFSNLKRLQESGITIAAGTDAGNIGTLHGPALHREFELMAEAGLTPQEILTAATRGGARVMGREAELGTLEAGKLADLVLLDADPLADITNVQRIYRVVKGGLILDPQALIKGQ